MSSGLPVPRSVLARVDSGTAELVPDPGRPGGWTLLVDGIAQSYVDLADPTRLEFGYARQVATVIDIAGRPGVPPRVLHLGGGALSLARYVGATRPGARQRVAEPDAALAVLVLRTLPLAGGVDVRLCLNHARDAVRHSPPGWADLVIGDAYQGARMPAGLRGVEYAAEVARVLSTGGLYVLNVVDGPAQDLVRGHAATLRAAFPEVCLIGRPGVPQGRRFANVVLVAAARPGALPVAALAAANAAPDPSGGPDPGGTSGVLAAPGLLSGPALDAFIGEARPFRDADQPVTAW